MKITEDMPFKAMRKTWQPVCLSRNLGEGTIFEYTLLDEDIVIVKTKDDLFVARDLCPHRGAKLGLGKIKNGSLTCAYHGWEFNTKGKCQRIPSIAGDHPVIKQACLTIYEVQERYGMVWVRLDKSGDIPLPEIPEFENDWTYLLPDQVPTGCGFRREIDNYLDMSHFAFAHAKSLGVAAQEIIEDIDISFFDGGFQMDAPFPRLDGPETSKLANAHLRQQKIYLPNFTTIRQSFEDGDERVLVHIPSPNSMYHCTLFWALAISPGFDGPPPEDQIEFAIGVYNEDIGMMENQRPLEAPLGMEDGIIVPADRLPMTFKRSFRKFVMETLDGKKNAIKIKSMEGDNYKHLILFGSQSGTAEQLANEFNSELIEGKISSEVLSMESFVDSININQERDNPFIDIDSKYRVLIITSTYGRGDPPDNAKKFYEWLIELPDNACDHLEYSLLALGSSQFPNFCQFGKDLDSLLQIKGAKPLTEIALCDGDPDEPFSDWKNAYIHEL